MTEVTDMDNFCIYCQVQYKDLKRHLRQSHRGTLAQGNLAPTCVMCKTKGASERGGLCKECEEGASELDRMLEG